MIEWPPTKSESNTCSTTSSCPIIAFRISRSRSSRAAPSLSSSCSSLIVSWSTAMGDVFPLSYPIISDFRLKTQSAICNLQSEIFLLPYNLQQQLLRLLVTRRCLQCAKYRLLCFRLFPKQVISACYVEVCLRNVW